jgi:hypothetical protein
VVGSLLLLCCWLLRLLLGPRSGQTVDLMRNEAVDRAPLAGGRKEWLLK